MQAQTSDGNDTSQPGNVLIVTSDYEGTGGIQTLTRSLRQGLKQRGIDVRVLSVSPSTIEWRLGDLVPRPGQIVSLRDLTGRHWPLRNRVADATKAALDEQRPDLVHVMNVTCWPALTAASEREIPTVLSVHALELQHQRLVAAALKNTDVVHSVSAFSASLLRSDHTTDVPIRTVPPMFDVSPFQSVSPSNTPSPVVLCLSRLVARKNVTTLLAAWERLPESLRDEWTLRIAGTGPDSEIVKKYENEHPSIEYLGYVSEERKRQEYADANLFALPATRKGYDTEGFGIVHLESQAAGTPTLGSRSGGVPEAVGDGGTLVDDECDPEDVAETLYVLLDDDEYRKRLATQATDRAQRFNIKQGTDKYLALYRSVGLATVHSEEEPTETEAGGETQ